MRTRLLVIVVLTALLLSATPASAVSYSHERTWATEGGLAPQDVASDIMGNVYAVGEGQDRVLKYDRTGVFTTAIGSTGSGDGQLRRPRGIALDRWGRIFVADQDNNRVAIFGGTAWQGSVPSNSGGPVRDVAVAPDQTLYVLLESRSIEVFEVHNDFLAPTWTYARTITPTAPLTGIACDLAGNLFASADLPFGSFTEGDRVCRWNRWGDPLTGFGVFGFGAGEFNRPFGVSVDPMGRVAVADSHNHRVTIHESDGTALTSFGTNGGGDGQFAWPYGARAGWRREIVVADNGNARLQKFKSTEPTVRSNVQGSTRIGTGVAAALAAYPDGCDQVLIATARNYPDALGGASLAGVLDAPILLTEPGRLSPEVATAIGTLGARRATILGSENAVGPAVFLDLEGLLGAGSVTRVDGVDRFQTAEMIAASTIAQDPTPSRFAFVATGRNFPDALAASPIAAANGVPIYLCERDSIRPSATQAMRDAGITSVLILGSTSAVGSDVETALDAEFSVVRVEGPDRYLTAASIAEYGMMLFGMNMSHLALATGDNYPDALAAGPLQGKTASILLLTRRDTLPTILNGLGTNKDSVHEIRYMGSTSAISQPVRDQVNAMLW